MNTNRFKQLLESTMGNVKPLISEELGSEQLSSPKGKDTKEWQTFFNSYYKLTLPVDGNWEDPNYNSTMKKYLEEKGIPVWVCKKGDGYCPDGNEGLITAKGNDWGNAIKAKKSDMVKLTQTNGQEKINTTNDKSYDYKLSNGKYYYSSKGQNKWTEATGKSLEAIKTKVKF